MSFLNLLKRYKISIIALIFTFFLLGYFFTDFVYNNLNARYVYEFNSDSENVNIVLDSYYYDEAIKTIDEYNLTAEKKISYASIDYKEMLKTASLTKESIYEFTVLKKYFPNIVRASSGTVNQGDNRIVNYFDLMFSYFPINYEYVGLKIINYQNPYLIGLYCSFGSLVLVLSLLLFGSLKKKEEVVIEDNENIFQSIFHKEYWKNSNTFMKNIKSLCTISILFSFMMVCKMLPIPSGFGSLGIGFTYLVFATITLIYGPVCGLFVGFCSDILGFFFFQQSQVFFPGYTLDAMLSGFIYGICFYKKRITFANCLIARFFVNIVINVGLGCLWWKIIYNLDFNGYLTYMMLTSLPKNVLYLLPQSILLFVLFKFLSKPLASFNLIDMKISENVSLF